LLLLLVYNKQKKLNINLYNPTKNKALSVTGREVPYGCETSRLPRLLDNRIIDGGKGHSAAGRIRYSEKSNDLIGNGTHDISACRIMPQPITLSRALEAMKISKNLKKVFTIGNFHKIIT
jgi:hypothetical protein